VTPNALETLIVGRAGDPDRAAHDAAPALHAIRDLGLSKYAETDPTARDRLLRAAERARPVIVVDQTSGDAAVSGAGANRDTFRTMLIAAVEENPDNPVLIKTHPETRLGKKAGHFDAALVAEARAASAAVEEAAASGRLGALTGAVAPRDVAEAAHRVYVVSSLLGFEALVAGAAVTVFGQSFYAGWGLTDDRAPAVARRTPAPLVSLAAAAYRDYAVYLSPTDRRPCDLEEAVEWLAGVGA
jgi:capsular polysaccharide export protein